MSPQPKNAPAADGAEATEAPARERMDSDAREAAAKAYVNVLFDEAFELNERYKGFLDTRNKNREALRQNVRFMDDDERALLEELYPERTITKRTPEERVAFLEEQARIAREKAAAKAAEAAA